MYEARFLVDGCEFIESVFLNRDEINDFVVESIDYCDSIEVVSVKNTTPRKVLEKFDRAYAVELIATFYFPRASKHLHKVDELEDLLKDMGIL